MSTQFKGGYHGKILRINLTSGKIWDEDLDPEKVRNGIGGIGLAMQYLYAMMDPAQDAFDEESPFIFMTGPLTATNAPSSGAYITMAKSPLNKMVARGMSNGFLGARIKSCGYDGVIITGKSEKPAYIWLNDKGVEIRSAQHIWGKNNHAAEDAVIAETSPRTSVATIGLAGERLVKYACVQSDHGHIASSGGLGAVMGSKNLKAFAADVGTKKTPIADPEAHEALCKEWFGILGKSPMAMGTKMFGSSAAVDMFIMMGDLPTKNYGTNDSKQYSYFSGQNMHKTFPLKTKNCYKCPISHCKWIQMPEGNKYGLDYVEEPEYEGLAAFGSLICVNDVYENVYLNYLSDDLGMDYKNFGMYLALSIECVEEGILSKDRIGGIDLGWGKADAAAEFMKAVAAAESDWSKFYATHTIKEVAEWIGGDAINRAVYSRTAGVHLHDTRSIWGLMLAHAVSEFSSTPTTGNISMGPAPEFGFTERAANSGDAVELHAKSLADLTLKGMINDHCVLCDYCCGNGGVSVKHVLNVLSAVTGESYDYASADFRVKKLVNLARAFNLRAGFDPKDEIPSERLMSAPVDGPVQGVTIKPYIADILRQYRINMGWDPEDGRPLPETLKKLEMEYVIPQLWN